MPSRPETFEFNDRETTALVAQMDQLAAAGKGWINLTPDLGDDERPEGSVALCTWVVGQMKRDRREPDSVGVQHASGDKAAARLRPAGITLPDGWRVVQDHRRRGLVVAVSPESSHGEVLAWLLRAGTALTDPAFGGRWRADVYQGR